MDVAVREAQRTQLLEAMLDELGARGYDGTTVDAAIDKAGVTRDEFEQEFAGEDDCLFAAYDYLRERVLEVVTGNCGVEASWPEQIREGLAALLRAVARQPHLAMAATRHFPALRSEGHERYVALLSSFVPYFAEGRAYANVDGELPGEVEMLAIGAAESLIFAEIDKGSAERLPQMLPEILFSVLVPFIGPERAAQEMRSAALG